MLLSQPKAAAQRAGWEFQISADPQRKAVPHLNYNLLKRNFKYLSILSPSPNKYVRKAIIYYIVIIAIDHLYIPDYYRCHPLFLAPPFFEVFSFMMVTSQLTGQAIISAKYKLRYCLIRLLYMNIICFFKFIFVRIHKLSLKLKYFPLQIFIRKLYIFFSSFKATAGSQFNFSIISALFCQHISSSNYTILVYYS